MPSTQNPPKQNTLFCISFKRFDYLPFLLSFFFVQFSKRMEEEIEALQAIFQDEFERLSTSCICITFNHIKPGPVSITVHYPPAASYPFEKQQSPAFEVNTVWPLHLKGPGHFYTLAEEDLAQLKESFINISAAASDVYMFEWIETFKVFMEEKFGIFDADEGDQDKEVDQLQVEAESLSLETTVKANGESCMTRCKIKIHTASEELVEKKSVFVGHVARVESVEEVKLVMKSLLENKRIGRENRRQ